MDKPTQQELSEWKAHLEKFGDNAMLNAKTGLCLISALEAAWQRIEQLEYEAGEEVAVLEKSESRKISLDDLEKILNSEDHAPITILPDGTIRELKEQ